MYFHTFKGFFLIKFLFYRVNMYAPTMVFTFVHDSPDASVEALVYVH